VKPIDFYFDYASPWSYLASELVEARLAGIEVRYVPIYIRGLESFASGMPYAGAKLAYLTQDLQRCADHERVPLAPPAGFPVNGLHMLRGALVADARGKRAEAHRALMRATWAEGADTSDPSVVCAILARTLGESAAAVAEAAASPEVKAKLREATDAAVKLGIFGVPTFAVARAAGDPELFWGHDRMDYAARAARRA
jgi:2-hydroxychromene-2-carboxylate isomerase